MLRDLRTRIVGWLGRRYLTRVDGLDLSKLPDRLLWPLKREGLDPVPEIAESRETEPITRLDTGFGFGAWLVSGHAEVREVLGMHDAFSTDFTNLIGNAGITEGRTPAASASPTRPTTPGCASCSRRSSPCAGCAGCSRGSTRSSTPAGRHGRAPTARSTSCRTFALPMPSLAICELLGVPYEDRARLPAPVHRPVRPVRRRRHAPLGAISESLEYLRDIVEKQRENPGDGLIGEADQGTRRRHHRRGAGRPRRRRAHRRPGDHGQHARARRAGAAARPASASRRRSDERGDDRLVEELLRYLTVVQVAFPRFAKEDMRSRGVKIEKGDVVRRARCLRRRPRRELGAGIGAVRPGPPPSLARGVRLRHPPLRRRGARPGWSCGSPTPPW